MPVDDEIAARLKSIVTTVSNRVYLERGPEDPPDSLFPMVIFSEVSGAPQDTDIRGVIVADQFRYQVTALGLTKASARAAASLVRTALQNYRSTTIRCCQFVNQTAFFDPDAETFNIPTDFEVSTY
jgi:hypothetical protein